MIDAAPPPKLWTPPKPAIIRARGDALYRLAPEGKRAVFPMPFFCPSRSLVETLVDRTTGTIFGIMNGNGGAGMTAAFDGNTNKALNSGARSADNVDAYLGKTYPIGKIFSRAFAYGSNNTGFIQATNPTTTLSIRGKNGAFSSAADGTLLSQISFTDTNNESAGRELVSTDTTNSWTDIALVISASGGNSRSCTQLVLYEMA